MSSFSQKDVFLYGKRWFFIMKPDPTVSKTTALLDVFPIEKLSKMVTVCLTITNFPGKQPKPNGKLIRLYTYFESYVDYYLFSISIPIEERSFFEIIFGSSAQKPHFDIDMSHDVIQKNYPGEDVEKVSEVLMDALITSCIHVLKQAGVSIEIEKSVLLYSSHSEKKKSFHLLLNGIYHRNNIQAKIFYKNVIEHLSTLTNKKYTEFIDPAVYSPKQQFRILGCQKPKTNRIKVFLESFTYNAQVYNHVYTEDNEDVELKLLCALYESMVGFVSGCNLLPDFKEIEIENTGSSEIKINRTVEPQASIVEATDSMSVIALEMLKSVMDPCPFTIYSVNKNIISLNRQAPSICPICAVIHEKQHPFMAITNEGRIYWNCRRTEAYKVSNKKFYVGTIPQDGSTFLIKPTQENTEEQKENTKHVYNGIYNPKPIEETNFSFGPFKTKLAMEEAATKNIIEQEAPIIPKKPAVKKQQNVVYTYKKSEKNVVDELQKIARDKANGKIESNTPKKIIRKEPLSFIQKESTLKRPVIVKKEPEQPKIITPIIPRKTPIKIIK